MIKLIKWIIFYLNIIYKLHFNHLHFGIKTICFVLLKFGKTISIELSYRNIPESTAKTTSHCLTEEIRWRARHLLIVLPNGNCLTEVTLPARQ